MYCEQCHYGSDICRFPVTGTLIEVIIDKKGNTEGRPECRCPHCGQLGVHFVKPPWGNERTRSMHPARSPANKQRRATNEEFFSDSPHKAVKALDYSKNAPSV